MATEDHILIPKQLPIIYFRLFLHSNTTQNIQVTVFLLYLRSLKNNFFFADRKIGITPKLTENLKPNTNSIPDAPVHACILIVKVRRCRTHITWVTFGYYRVSFYDIRIKLFPFLFVLKTTIAEE